MKYIQSHAPKSARGPEDASIPWTTQTQSNNPSTAWEVALIYHPFDNKIVSWLKWFTLQAFFPGRDSPELQPSFPVPIARRPQLLPTWKEKAKHLNILEEDETIGGRTSDRYGRWNKKKTRQHSYKMVLHPRLYDTVVFLNWCILMVFHPQSIPKELWFGPPTHHGKCNIII